MKNNLIYKFLVETVNRLLSKNSKYVKVLQTIALIATLITGVPEVLEYFGVVLTPTLIVLQNKIIAIVGIVSMFILQLEVPKAETPKVTSYGVSLQSVKKEVELPFTEATK